MREEESTLTIDIHGDKYWRNKKGKLHRINGPAIEYYNGSKAWYQMGRQHRIDGPAIETIDGIKRWFIRGERFESKEAFFDSLNDEEKSIALFSEAFLNA